MILDRLGESQTPSPSPPFLLTRTSADGRALRLQHHLFTLRVRRPNPQVVSFPLMISSLTSGSEDNTSVTLVILAQVLSFMSTSRLSIFFSSTKLFEFHYS